LGYGAKTTIDLANEIVTRHDTINLWVIDDASGNSRQQADAVTNRQILKRAGIRNIDERKSNPPVEQRFANTNAWLRNARGECRIFIDPKCKNLINELRTYSYKKSTGEPDDRGNTVGHITSAFSYAVYGITGGLIPSNTIIQNFRDRYANL